MKLNFKKSNNLLPCDGEVYYFESVFKYLELEKIQKIVKWRQDEITLFGKTHPIPRLHQWYAKDGLTYSYSKIKLIPLDFPKEINEILEKINDLTSIDFNSLLMNLYRNGSDSNGWHSDNEKELGVNPPIASISLGETRRFSLKHRKKDLKKIDIDLTHGSLLVMKGDTQHHWLHQISKSKKVNGPRVNFTFRKVSHN